LTGSLTLARYPHARLRIACDRCQRHGDYSTARLIERHGPDYRLPDLQADLTLKCAIRENFNVQSCDATFPDLRGHMLNRIVAVVLASGLATQASAEPGPTVTYLMNEPASMFDIGIIRMEKTVEDQLAAPFGTETMYSYVGYDFNKNRIYVGGTFIVAPEFDGELTGICESAIENLATALGLYLVADFRAHVALTMGEYFGHQGYARSNQPEEIGDKLLEIVAFEARIIGPNETLFDKPEPDCRREWTDGAFPE